MFGFVDLIKFMLMVNVFVKEVSIKLMEYVEPVQQENSLILYLNNVRMQPFVETMNNW